MGWPFQTDHGGTPPLQRECTSGVLMVTLQQTLNWSVSVISCFLTSKNCTGGCISQRYCDLSWNDMRNPWRCPLRLLVGLSMLLLVCCVPLNVQMHICAYILPLPLSRDVGRWTQSAKRGKPCAPMWVLKPPPNWSPTVLQHSPVNQRLTDQPLTFDLLTGF